LKLARLRLFLLDSDSGEAQNIYVQPFANNKGFNMPYDLLLVEPPTPNRDRGFGNVFLNDLPAGYKVYLFYYGGAMPDDELESRLRKLGEIANNNLYVNTGTLGDPQHGAIASRFEIKHYPVILLTAIDALASPADEYFTAYVRLDSKYLLQSPDRTIQCVQEVFTLFLEGKVTEAMALAKGQQRTELLRHVGGFFAGALKSLGGFIADRDLSIGFANFKLELKKSKG